MQTLYLEISGSVFEIPVFVIKGLKLKSSKCVIDFVTNILHLTDCRSNLVKVDLNVNISSFSIFNVSASINDNYLVSEEEILWKIEMI